MSLAFGARFGVYEILEPIGAGGMGSVYRARDTKLERDVAIKVLQDELSHGKGRLERFEREARLLAQLNHSNIATIHGLEEYEQEQLLVMELVDGETLAARLARGPVSVHEATSLFLQVASGLEAAHEKGIIHRDLKPANIMISTSGQVKILDFGLAKVRDRATSPNPSEAVTAARQTAEGSIVGTAPYMSPEQARGEFVDRRTDVWAFACCLFESLTGKTAFSGRTTPDLISHILNSDPDWDALPFETPSAMRRLLRRCLRKEANNRIHDIADARIELLDVPEGEEEGPPVVPTETRNAGSSGTRRERCRGWR